MQRSAAQDSKSEHAPRTLVRAAEWLIRLRLPLLVFCMVTAALALGPSLRLKFDRSVEGLFHEDDPRLVHYREDKRLFGEAETALVAYTDRELLTEEGLRRLERLDEQLSGVAGVLGVLSLKDARLPGAPLDPRTLREHLAAGSVTSEELRRKLLDSELYRGRLLAEDGRTAVLLVSLAAREDSTVTRAETIRQIREISDAHDPPAVLAGGPVLVEDVYTQLEKDGRILGIAASVVLAVVIGLLFRNLRWVLLPLAVVHLTLVWTKALLVVGGMRLSMVSSPLVALVTVIGVATVVHVAIRFREERAGYEPASALRRTLVHIGPAIFWTCLTTAAGFSSLMASRIAPVGSFGLMMALGSALVFAACMGLVPAGVLLGRRHTDPAHAPGERKVAAFLDRVVRGVERRPWRVAGIGLGALALTSLGIFRLQVATDFEENFRGSSPIVESYRFLSERLGTTATFDVLIDAPPAGDRKEFTGFLHRLRDLQSELNQQEGVTGTLSIVNVLDFVQGPPREGVAIDKLIDAFSRSVLPGRKEPARLEDMAGNLLQLLPPAWLLERLHEQEPELISQFWNREQNAVRIVVQVARIKEAGAKQQLIETAQGSARRAFPSARTAGVEILLTYMVQSLLADQWITFSLAVTAIVVMMTIAFRDWRLGLIALVPNAFPILVVLGVIGWVGLKINVATAMLASVSMGLAVDFSIHYLYRFRDELRQGKAVPDALREAHGSVGLAMVLANLALMAGFSTLTVSAFVPTIHFGILVSVAMLGGLVGNFTALPLLLRLWNSQRVEESKSRRVKENASSQSH